MGVWGLGSLVGGVLATRLGGGARSAAGLALVLAGLDGGHLALAAGSGNVVALGAVLFVAGAGIAPVFASVYAMVDRVAPSRGRHGGLRVARDGGRRRRDGCRGRGAVADGAGPGAAFVLAGGAGVVAVLVALRRASTLPGGESPRARAGAVA